MIPGDETMRKTATKILLSACAVAVISGTLLMAPFTTASAEESTIEKGKAVAFDRTLGNCLSCHAIEGGELPGNIGPPLVGMKLRFPDKAKLREQIADSTIRNPNSIMPPFGRFNLLTTEQIDQVVEFVYSL
jgi:sulfur-oxidizing protein SoxX